MVLKARGSVPKYKINSDINDFVLDGYLKTSLSHSFTSGLKNTCNSNIIKQDVLPSERGFLLLQLQSLPTVIKDFSDS